jgi:hypothetical protein
MRAMKVIRIVLQSIGALTLILLLGATVYAFASLSGPKHSTDKDDAVFVLNWAGLNTAQHWTVIDGSISPRNITGDHTDFYCIQLDDISINQRNPVEWRSGPESNELMSEALEQAISWAKYAGATCFPPFELANSESMKILFWGMTTHGRSPAGAQVLLLQPATKQLFYVSFDT